MIRRRYCIIACCVIAMGFVLSAFAQDMYPFQSQTQAKQFNQLTRELRCLVCQNESLAASNAPLAADLRNTIYAMVKMGDSSRTIKQYMLSRYGDFVLFKPPFSATTAVLWVAPFVLLLLSFIIGWVVVKRNRLIDSDVINKDIIEEGIA